MVKVKFKIVNQQPSTSWPSFSMSWAQNAKTVANPLVAMVWQPKATPWGLVLTAQMSLIYFLFISRASKLKSDLLQGLYG